MVVPNPTPIYRLVHIDNLATILRRGGLHASKYTPEDGLPYRTIHNVDIQNERHVRRIPCGPCGTLHDYVPFYFGYLSPMLLQLKTGRVVGYTEGQESLIYLVSYAQSIAAAGSRFIFSDGHGIAAFTKWYDSLAKLDQVDWNMVYQRYWTDKVDDMDRQRRKQAEFLIYQFCPWTQIQEIGVLSSSMKTRVEEIMAGFSRQCLVKVQSSWYYS